MNRKVAVAAIVGGMMHTMSVLRGQEVQTVPTRVRLPVGELLPPQGIAPLTPAVAEDLQRQITELAARVSVLEQTQANTAGFTKVGNDYVFAPVSGNVSIKAPMDFTIKGSAAIRLHATGNVEQRGAMILIN
jgi:hypothetical protein